MGGGLKLCLGFWRKDPTDATTVLGTELWPAHHPQHYTPSWGLKGTHRQRPPAAWRKDPTGPKALETRLGQLQAQGGGRARTPGDPEGGLRAPATGH